MEYIKVKGHEGLARDPSSGAIINTNRGDYEHYVQARNRAQQRDMEISRQAEEINNIKEDIGQIKDMLTALLNKTV